MLLKVAASLDGRIRGMGFVLIEEWGDEENPHKFYNVPVLAGTFETKEEADEEAKKRQPQHGGIIRVVRERSETAPLRRKGRKKARSSRESRRRSSRR